MEVKYKISYLEVVIKKHIPALPKKIQLIVRRAIEQRLMIDPIGFGKPLQYSLKGHRRIRVGDYRIVYSIEHSSKEVLVIAIQHRRDIYD